MNLEKVVFGFFILLALTLNFGFFVGALVEPDHHNVYEFFAALVVNLIATVLKFGERTQIGALLLASSLVADLQLVAAAVVWGMAVYVWDGGVTAAISASIISLAGGALLANLASATLLIIETVSMQR